MNEREQNTRLLKAEDIAVMLSLTPRSSPSDGGEPRDHPTGLGGTAGGIPQELCAETSPELRKKVVGKYGRAFFGLR
jgi:hypothetical protein